MDVIQSHHNDMQGSLKTESSPFASTQPGGSLSIKKSKMRGRHWKDSGSRARATAFDVERPGKKGSKWSSGP